MLLLCNASTVLSEGLSLTASAFSPRCFADKAGVWYVEVLLPLGLCPYVLYYALGGAMLSSSVLGGNKAGLFGPNDA